MFHDKNLSVLMFSLHVILKYLETCTLRPRIGNLMLPHCRQMGLIQLVFFPFLFVFPSLVSMS